MIKTECKRITIKNNFVPPDNVKEKLKLFDPKLELIFNADANRWEFYRRIKEGITENEDILCWQMSVPTQGTNVSVGIVDWIKQFDTTLGGKLSIYDLRNAWLKNIKNIFNEQRLKKEKREDETAESWKHLIQDFGSQKTVVSVPICVGYNKKRNKQIFAVKKKEVNNIN